MNLIFESELGYEEFIKGATNQPVLNRRTVAMGEAARNSAMGEAARNSAMGEAARNGRSMV